MALPTVFLSGDVFTAANANLLRSNQYNQTVSTKTTSYTLVAADVGTRIVMNSASATTITVNTSLFSAGDTLVLQNIGAGVCTVTAGTATVSSAGPLAIPQNGSGILYFTSAGVSIYYPSAVTASASALTLISSTAISAQTSVAIDNVFTSTYTNYLVLFDNFVAAGSMSLRLQWRYAGPTTQTTLSFYALSGYNYAGTLQTQLQNSGASIFVLQTTSGASQALSQVNISGVGNSSQQPVATINSFDNGFLYYLAGGANTDQARTYTGFILTSSNANNFTGNVRIYGYQKS